MNARWMKLLAEELADLQINLMDMARNTIQPSVLGYGYKPGVSELAAVLKWRRAYEHGTATYEDGCNVLRDGVAVYNGFVDALYTFQHLARMARL